jgi:cold shock CspA family protein
MSKNNSSKKYDGVVSEVYVNNNDQKKGRIKYEDGKIAIFFNSNVGYKNILNAEELKQGDKVSFSVSEDKYENIVAKDIYLLANNKNMVDNTRNNNVLTFNQITDITLKNLEAQIVARGGSINGDIYTVAISHGEGRFLCDEALLRQLAANGQIATQYVDLAGNPTDDIRYNPNDSAFAVEGITSPDGRVFGKMGHSERIGNGLYKNVPGAFDMKMFESAVKYFK